MESGTKTRIPAVAGSFYPDNKEELISQLEIYFARAKKIPIKGKIKALIVPHAGYIYSGKTAAWGYKQLPVNLQNPHFVLICPSHHYPFNGLVSSSSEYWQTPLGKIRQIPIHKERKIISDETPHIPEHSLEVQLPFLQSLYQDFSVSCLLTGNDFNFDETANYLLGSYSSSIFIFSSDLSHYLPYEIAYKKDRRTIKAILNRETDYFLSRDNTACGMMGIMILMAMAQKEKWQSKLLNYDTSATTSGDKSAVVGYAAIGFYQ